MPLISIAVLPVVFLMNYIYKLDKLEYEPKEDVRRVIIFGIISAVPAVVLEILFQVFVLDMLVEMRFIPNQAVYVIIECFLGVALVEELCKFVAMRIGIWNSIEFDFYFDGIVYCVAASLGFAGIENVLYVITNGIATGLIRALTSVPAHAAFGVFMGYYIAKAKNNELHGLAAKKWLGISLLVPTIFHGIYDSLLGLAPDWTLLAWFIFTIVMDIIAFRLVKKAAREDKEFVAAESTDMV